MLRSSSSSDSNDSNRPHKKPKQLPTVIEDETISSSKNQIVRYIPESQRWVVTRFLGENSYGSIWLAMCTSEGDLDSLPDEMVIKSTRISEASRLKKEEEFLTRLKSHFVVSCYGHEITEDERNTKYYNSIVEYCPHQTLAKHIIRGKGLPEKDVKEFAMDILIGLKYIHGEKIIHCDIKPKNILLLSEEDPRLRASGFRAKISGFGKAMEEGSIEYSDGWGHMRGTTRFMSPELIGEEFLGYGADVWAFGCTVLEMLTGERPWGEHGELDWDNWITVIGESNLVPYVPDCLSENAQDFLSNCLEKDPAQRWSVDRLMKHEFFRWKHEDEEDEEVDEEEEELEEEESSTHFTDSTADNLAGTSSIAEMKIIAGADAFGASLKDAMVSHLRSLGMEVEDTGVSSYYSAGSDVGRRVSASSSSLTRGLVCCQTGVGIAMFANKFPGVYAATCLTVEDAVNARSISNCNVLALSGMKTSPETAVKIFVAWIKTPFKSPCPASESKPWSSEISTFLDNSLQEMSLIGATKKIDETSASSVICSLAKNRDFVKIMPGGSRNIMRETPTSAIWRFKAGSVEPAHHHTFGHDMVVLKGRKTVWNLSKKERVDLGEGDYLFTSAGDVHRVKYHEDTELFTTWDGHWDIFLDEDLEAAKKAIEEEI